MDRIPSGIPDKFFDLSKNFKVIDHKSSIVDEDLNERIQKEGAHFGGSGSSELEWYRKNKGYSERL